MGGHMEIFLLLQKCYCYWITSQMKFSIVFLSFYQMVIDYRMVIDYDMVIVKRNEMFHVCKILFRLRFIWAVCETVRCALKL